MSVQAKANQLCRDRGIPPIPIKFSQKDSKGAQAVYVTHRQKGSTVLYPSHIVIYMPQWFAEKYWDEVTFLLAHEIAHHETCVKENSTQHTIKHRKLTALLENKLRKM